MERRAFVRRTETERVALVGIQLAYTARRYGYIDRPRDRCTRSHPASGARLEPRHLCDQSSPPDYSRSSKVANYLEASSHRGNESVRKAVTLSRRPRGRFSGASILICCGPP